MAEKSEGSGATCVNISEFIVEWSDQLADGYAEVNESTDFIGAVAKKMDITTDMATELEKVCGLSCLTCEGEPTGMFSGPSEDSSWKQIPDNVTNLSSLRARREEQQKRANSAQYRRRAFQKFRYKQLDIPWLHEIKHRQHRQENLSVPQDAILTMQVYNPYYTNPPTPLRISQEIHVLSQQTLAAARDKIECRQDNVVIGEFSAHIELRQDMHAKDLYPSGFFYIENVFYNDMRHPNARDYSLVIREWAAKDPKQSLGPYTTASMETTTFDMLTVRLGHPYLYLHQGRCEHLIVFSDIRIVHPEDCLKTEEYPIVVNKYKPKGNKCRVCLRNSAVWMTRNSPFAPEDPCYFCDTCYIMLHYSKSGEKLGNFLTYSCKDS